MYMYIYIYIYLLESRSLRSRILALRWRCGVGLRTARMSDAAFLLTKKILKIVRSDSKFQNLYNLY